MCFLREFLCMEADQWDQAKKVIIMCCGKWLLNTLGKQGQKNYTVLQYKLPLGPAMVKTL